MKLSKQAITSFQKIYQAKTGKKLTDEQAQAEALASLQQFAFVYQRIPRKEVSFLNKLKGMTNAEKLV